MPRSVGSPTPRAHVRKTFSLPRTLVEQMQQRVPNVSAFVAEACQEKLEADARKVRELEMIERCQVRHAEDVELASEFRAAEDEAWDMNR